MTDFAKLGRKMIELDPEVCRALAWSIVHPKLRPDSVVEVRMWRDGRMEQRTADGTVIRNWNEAADD